MLSGNSVTTLTPQGAWWLQGTGWAHYVQLLLHCAHEGHCANSWCPPLNSAYLQAIAHKSVWLWPGNMAGLPGGSLSWSHTSALSSLVSKLVGRGTMADLCLQLLKLQMQFGISIRHCHAGIQFTETFGGEWEDTSWLSMIIMVDLQTTMSCWTAFRRFSSTLHHQTQQLWHCGKETFSHGYFPFTPQELSLTELSVLLSRDPQSHCFNMGCAQNHGWGEPTRAASSALCLVTWEPLWAAVSALGWDCCSERLSQCHNQTLLHHQTFADEAKIV